MTTGDPIRILHTLEHGFGWHFISPDVDGMVGGATTYDEARQRAEYLVRVHLEGHDGAHDHAGRTAGTVRFAHFVAEDATELRGDEVPALQPPV